MIPCIETFSHVDKPFVHYIQRGNSIANNQNEKNADIFTVLDNVLEYYKNEGIYEEYKTELEYTYTRILLCSSLKRICKIREKKIRKELIDLTWKKLNEEFPEWKKNKILISDNTLKGKYMKSVNNFTYKIYTKIF